MEVVLRGLTYESYPVYLNNEIVFCPTLQLHLLQLRKLFQPFRVGRLKLNPEKCQLFQKDIWDLKHIVPPKGITTNPEKLKVL
jgi:hypothetical protein